jgi:hypothetical protein
MRAAWTPSATGSRSSGCPPTPPSSTQSNTWANLKGGELANFADDTIAEVANQAQHGIQRVCASESLVVGFLAHTGLTPDDEPSP